MEFKGTKGNWHWEYSGDYDLACLVNEENIEICNFGNNFNYYPTEGTEPNEYDALLISKAPELLRELTQEVDILIGLGLGYTDRCQRKIKLIKESTEI